MSDLLKYVIEAHGGMARWNSLQRVSADLEVGGVLWALKGQPDFAGSSRVTVELHQEQASHFPFMDPDLRSVMAPGRVELQTREGVVVESRTQPRDSFAGHVLETPWDRIQLAYFAGYAMWTYLAAPFCFASEGFGVSELGPWQENGETWRRLRVRFPDRIATHSVEQTFYYDAGGLLRRHDYEVDVSGGSPAAHYVDRYEAFDGIMVPTRRRVFVRDGSGRPLPEPLVVSVDLSGVQFS